MKRLEPGEHGDIFVIRRRGRRVGRVRYRRTDGTLLVIERVGSSKEAVKSEVKRALDAACRKDRGARFVATDKMADVIDYWVVVHKLRVDSGEIDSNTHGYYCDIAKGPILRHFGKMRVKDFTPPSVSTYLMGNGQLIPDARTNKVVLSSIAKMLVMSGAMDANPVREVALPKARAKMARSLTDDELSRWLDFIDSEPRSIRADFPDMVRVQLATGLRIGELLAVSWRDVDLHTGQLDASHQVTWDRAARSLVRKSRMKTASSDRTLMLPDWGVRLLRGRATVTGGALDTPVFPSRAGTYRWRNNVSRTFRELTDGTEWDWVVPHTHRKTVATMLHDQGVPMREISDQLGHSSVSVTQNTYIGRGVALAGKNLQLPNA